MEKRDNKKMSIQSNISQMKKLPKEPKGDTTIKISKLNRERLAKQGLYGESLDDILGRVLDIIEKKTRK